MPRSGRLLDFGFGLNIYLLVGFICFLYLTPEGWVVS